MINCYEILGLRKNATAAEIKKAYRQKVKLFHPDTGNANDTEQFRQIVQAYEILSDQRQRSIFDSSYSNRPYYSKKEQYSFDYYTWLSERTDQESRAKLIFFDLMHNKEDEAVQEFKRMNIEHADFNLKKWFTREDFMDYGYILAEELTLRKEYYDAIILLEQIIRMEYSYNYFRLFFPEVMEFTLSILKKNIQNNIPDELALDVWERALDLGFSASDDAFFLRKMAETYKKIGDEQMYSVCLEESVKVTIGKKQRGYSYDSFEE